MGDERIKIEVNGQELEARPGQMLIEVTDAADIYIPRFCYHEKLSVAANCRMCLVEVEKAPKPLPACATPVAPGMKVFTRSARAIAAQKATMEFLLINHPLDCPICDQGGECELQDLAMGYGRDISRFNERKRVVRDKDIGPLVSTDMTRCIHCTRCVRFGQEIAGIQELGTIGRGERMQISTFVERSVDHELSGNIIDLCPVGALNNKPYRFSARAWEMAQRETVAPHDCLGSNLYAHVLNGVVKRVVPRSNEAINETWATDRDRFSYEGIYAADRLQTPLLRVNGELRPCSWDDALHASAAALEQAGSGVGVLVSPSATLEEGYLAQRLVRHLGSSSIDHRLRRRDFRQQDADPLFPWLGADIASVQDMRAILVVGSNLRAEVPLLAHRVRKAAVKGARVSFLNAEQYEYLFPVAAYHRHDDLVAGLASLVLAAGKQPGKAVRELLAGATAPGEAEQATLAALREAPALIWLGQISMRHPRFAELRLLAAELAGLTGAVLGYIPEGANSAGLSLAGVVPHRLPGGKPVAQPGRSAAQMLTSPSPALLLLGAEAEFDGTDAQTAAATLQQASALIAISPFMTDALRAHASVVLPAGTFAETAGTFVNAEGRWQSFAGVAQPVGESRPAWKILRVLGNLLQLPDCEYQSAEAVRDELAAALGQISPDNSLKVSKAPEKAQPVAGPQNLDVPIYQVDALVRRATALQDTREGRAGRAWFSAERRVA